MIARQGVWGLAAILALVVLGGIGLLFVRLKPYWVARYQGRGADLHGAVLVLAPRGSMECGAVEHGPDRRLVRLPYPLTRWLRRCQARRDAVEIGPRCESDRRAD